MKRLLVVLSVVLVTMVATSCRVLENNDLVTNRGADKDQWWSELPREAWRRYPKIAHSQDWFEVYRITDEVLAIYEPGQFEEVISWLILGSDRALLFDTGLGIGDMAALVAELTDLPLIVLNSHSHYDHIGGNHGFDTIYGSASAYTGERARGIDHQQVAEFVGPGWIWKPTPQGFDPAQYTIAPFAISHKVRDGELIDLGDRRLEVLLTPGHAPDALCLLDREKRLLFSGDTFYPAPLYAHLPGSDLAQYTATAKRLAGLSNLVDALMPGHNEPAISAEYLPALDQAMQAIADQTHPWQPTDGNREYRFDGFSVITPE